MRITPDDEDAHTREMIILLMSGSCTNNTANVINYPGKKAPQVPGSNSSVQVAVSSQLIKGQGLFSHHGE